MTETKRRLNVTALRQTCSHNLFHSRHYIISSNDARVRKNHQKTTKEKLLQTQGGTCAMKTIKLERVPCLPHYAVS